MEIGHNYVMKNLMVGCNDCDNLDDSRMLGENAPVNGEEYDWSKYGR